jgi:hypothetical protein
MIMTPRKPSLPPIPPPLPPDDYSGKYAVAPEKVARILIFIMGMMSGAAAIILWITFSV